MGSTLGDIKGDTRSLDYSSCSPILEGPVVFIGPLLGFHVRFQECKHPGFPSPLLLGFKVQGLGFRVQGLGWGL